MANLSQFFGLIYLENVDKILGMEHLEKMKEAALAAGQILKKYFGQELELKQKTGVSDFSTKADWEAEKAILEILKKDFGAYNYITEEAENSHNNSEFTFVIDPLDGTNNFVTGIPYFSVSIALMKGDNIEAAVIYQPIVEAMYFAQRGQGAFLNEQKISVSDISEIKNANISYVSTYGHPAEDYGRMMHKLEVMGAKRVFYNWSIALDYCLLASGRMQIIINEGCEIYDYLAGKLIAKEAGAILTDFAGLNEAREDNNRFICVSHKNLLDPILNILKK